MPFKSEKQRKYLWANEPEIARDWTKTYGSKVKKADGGIMQDGYVNFTKGSDSVTVPQKFKSRKDATPTHLAYITKAEAAQLKKQNKGTPHKGPKGIPSYDDYDATGGGYGRATSGSQMSAAETGGGGHGMSGGEAAQHRAAAKAAAKTSARQTKSKIDNFRQGSINSFVNRNKYKNLINAGVYKGYPGMMAKVLGFMNPPSEVGMYDEDDIKTLYAGGANPKGLAGLRKDFEFEEKFKDVDPTQKQFEDYYGLNQPIDTGGEGGGNPYIYPYGMADASTTTDGTKTTTDEAWTPNFFVEDRFVSGPRRAKTRAAQGGRIGYAEGGDDAEWRKIYNKYKAKQIALGQEFADFEEFVDQHRVNEAQGGRIGYDDGGDVMMASYGYDDAMAETFQMYLDGQKNGTVPIDMEFDEFLELLPDQSKAPQQDSGIMAAAMGGRAEYNRGGISDLVAGAPEIRLSGDVRPQFQEQQETIQGPGFTEQETTEEASMPAIMNTLNEMSMQIFGKPFDQLNDREKQSLQELSAQTLQEEGGRERAAYGGIMESATGRRAYGFGSFFKSVTKPFKKAAKVVKKVAKSPLGKMALGYLATAGMANLAGGMGGAQPWSKFKWLKPEMLKGNLFGTLGTQGLSPGHPAYRAGTEGLLGMANLTKGFGGLKPTALGMITGASTAAGLMTKKPPEEFDSGIGKDRKEESDWWKNYLADMRSTYGDFELEDQYKLAEGGRIGKEEGGLMNLGGVEKDYRETGGFVEIGGEEKADDVPARLSRNEFVMTADAVRGAGNGDIDKGAAIMEDTMKTLETQGKKGAQDMFETSERIGEII